MKKLLSAFKRPDKEEKDSILEGSGSGKYQKYISINNDASGSSSSSEGSPTVTCPTCRGIGRIPRGQERELVALIPYSDQRLKPRRTKCYVCIAVISCLVICAIVAALLIQLSVTVDHAGVNSSLVIHDDSSSTVYLETTNKLNITNDNLIGIKILELNVEVLHMSVVVGNLNLKEDGTVGSRVTNQLFYTVKSKVQDPNTFKVCTWDQIRIHNILLIIQGSLKFSHIGHEEEVQFSGYEYLDCQKNSTDPQ
ncbi:transmembrane protein 106A isoform X2 [Rana temporaria]|uniref:transmembrane protein 106A isoform X2 n=1 Tax=Rana temporaria TaxID=8407 RepID=UPI001AAD9060|nr:transmembrane protein 106A isoform X2 [Rana temporaria]